MYSIPVVTYVHAEGKIEPVIFLVPHTILIFYLVPLSIYLSKHDA